jgi:hypothetical protein
MLKEIKVGLWDHLAVCVCLCITPSTFERLTQSDETWYAFHGNWVHLNGIVHKPLPSETYIAASQVSEAKP